MSIRRVARAIFTTGLLVILPAQAFAQEVGVKAGANFASLTPEEDESPDTSRHIGLVAGVWFRTPTNTAFSFQAETLFSEKGVKFDNLPFVAPGASADFRVRYVEVPLLTRVDFTGANTTLRVFVVGGAAPAFKLSARSKLEAEGQEHITDADDDVESADVGLVVGGGVEFGRALIEARYTHGLLKINVDDNDPNDRIQNRVFGVIFGFRLH